MFSERAEALRRRVLRPWPFFVFLLAKLPLAAAAGLRIVRLDGEGCEVRLPGGWRTQNPFGSTYFAAQCMAAEMSTGAPALVLARGAPVSVALIVVEVRASYAKRVVGVSRYVFSDMAGLAAAVARAAGQDEPVSYVARSVALLADGQAASEFAITWSFRRRPARA
jgi:hypothetical protein